MNRTTGEVKSLQTVRYTSFLIFLIYIKIRIYNVFI